jgi:hypothetical protein
MLRRRSVGESGSDQNNAAAQQQMRLSRTFIAFDAPEAAA